MCVTFASTRYESQHVCVPWRGVGLADGGRRSGLANLEARAATHGGTLRVRSGPDGGTSLTWTVPRR